MVSRPTPNWRTISQSRPTPLWIDARVARVVRAFLCKVMIMLGSAAFSNLQLAHATPRALATATRDSSGANHPELDTGTQDY
jgi:hypothetical protein